MYQNSGTTHPVTLAHFLADRDFLWAPVAVSLALNQLGASGQVPPCNSQVTPKCIEALYGLPTYLARTY